GGRGALSPEGRNGGSSRTERSEPTPQIDFEPLPPRAPHDRRKGRQESPAPPRGPHPPPCRPTSPPDNPGREAHKPRPPAARPGGPPPSRASGRPGPPPWTRAPPRAQPALPPDHRRDPAAPRSS